MRLDRFLSENASLSRKTAKHALHRGDVLVDGQVIRKGDLKIKEQVVTLNGDRVSHIGLLYFMLHKPVDYVCSTVDDDGESVLNLIDESLRNGLHTAGRLDKDTTGLVLLTNDGQWSHRVTSPKRDCEKVYLVTLHEPLNEALIEVFANGIQLNNESGLTKPARLELLENNQARLTITEGKYHQVKRMFAAVDNHVVSLHRERIGPISMPEELTVGQVKKLTEEEVKFFS